MSVQRSPTLQSGTCTNFNSDQNEAKAKSPFPHLDVRLKDIIVSSPQMKNVQQSPVVDLTPQMRSRSTSNITIEMSAAKKRARDLRSPEVSSQPSKLSKPGNKSGSEEGEIDDVFEEEAFNKKVILIDEEDEIVDDEKVVEEEASKENVIFIDEEDKTVNDKKVVEEEAFKEKVVYVDEEDKVVNEEKDDNEDKKLSNGEALMIFIQNAINTAITPLYDEIRLLNNVIKESATKDEMNELKNEIRNLVAKVEPVEAIKQTDIQSASSFYKKNGERIPAGGKQKVLEQMSYSSITASNLRPNDNEGSNGDRKKSSDITARAEGSARPLIGQPSKSQSGSNPAYALARRCLGFYPVTSKDINRYEDLCKDMTKEEKFQKLGKDCIRDFLNSELEISARITKDIRMKNVFYPTAGIASGTLYVEFESEDEADIVRRHQRNLKERDGFRPKIVHYIPRSLYKRFQAIEEKAFNIRNKNRQKTTRVWIGEDFQLRVRDRGDTTPWTQISPEAVGDLPPQDPKVRKSPIDHMDTRRPFTPSPWLVAPKSFESSNRFDFLGQIGAN